MNYIAILSLWKRKKYLGEQLSCLKRQTIQPKQIWLCHGVNRDNLSLKGNQFLKKNFDKIETLEDGGSVFSRFEMANESNENCYFFIIDDDMFPSDRYCEICLQEIENNGESIIASSGRTFLNKNYFPNNKHGSVVRDNKKTKVHIGTNGWFLSKESIKCLLENHSNKGYNNCEDIALSYLNRNIRGVETITINQNKEINSDIYFHARALDDVALSNPKNHNKFYKQRNEMLEFYMEKELKEKNKEIDWFLDNLKNSIPFAFSRFNDGEMLSILGESYAGTISRGDQETNRELSTALLKSIKHQQNNYYVGIPCSICYPRLHKHALGLVGDYKHKVRAVVNINRNWKYFINNFLNILKDRQICWIGNKQHNVDFFKNHGIEIKIQKKYEGKNDWNNFEQIYEMGVKSFTDGDVVLISLGPVGRILSQKWFEKMPKTTFLEIGSCFDPFTRGVYHNYHKGWEETGFNMTKRCLECN